MKKKVNLISVETLCEAYGLKHKMTSAKNLQVNTLREHVHQALMGMLCTGDINMAETIIEADRADSIKNATASHSTY